MEAQQDLFNDTPRRTAPAEDFDAAGAGARLYCLAWFLLKWTPASAEFRAFYYAAEPWQKPEDAERASAAVLRKINRRKHVDPRAGSRELDAAMPWTMHRYRLGRADVLVCSPAHGQSPPLTREVAEDSARSIALLCDAPAEVVVRYVLTGAL